MSTENLVAITTRIRLARNLSDYNFPSVIRGTVAERQIMGVVSNFFDKLGGYKFLQMNQLSEDERNSLYERYFISKNLLASSQGAVAISSDSSISIMVNEEDHIREQCLISGFDLYEAYKRISYIDERLSRNLRFAKNANFHFTSCPSNLGTGMRASVMMFLPALSFTGAIDRIMQDAKNHNITFRGAFGEGSNAEGFWYQVSNSRTIASVDEILNSVNDFVLSVCDMENDERYHLYDVYGAEIEDNCYRAYGVLKHAKLLSYDECMNLIAKVKLGSALGFIKLTNHKALDDLLVTVRPATLSMITGGTDDFKARASYVNNALETKIKLL